MRPKLKSDTFFIPVDEGIYLRNNEHAHVLKGKTTASWIEQLAPLLTGQYDDEQIYDAVPPGKQAVATKIINTLIEYGYARDVSTDHPHTLSSTLQRTYEPAITFIDYHEDSGPYRFQHFLTLPVLAIGTGDALIALAHALLETGNRHIYLLDTGQEKTDYERLTIVFDLLQTERDAELSLTRLTFSDWHDSELIQKLVASFHMVIAFDTTGSETLTRLLATACFQVGVFFLPAIVQEKEVVMGPIQKSNQVGCWQCYWLRRTATARVNTEEDKESASMASSVTYLSAPAIGITANLLAFEFFKHGTGVLDESLTHEVFTLELERLQTSHHRVFAHPLCPVCQNNESLSLDNFDQRKVLWQKQYQLLQQQQKTYEVPDLLKQAVQWTDETCGIFTRIREDDYYHLPLVRSRITLPSPSETGAAITVQAAGLDYKEVQLEATTKAIACYLDRLIDSSNIMWISLQDIQHQNHVCPMGNSPSLTVSEPSRQQPFAWSLAYQLADGQPVLVPSSVAYPYFLWNTHGKDIPASSSASGVGIGSHWWEAVACGIKNIGSTFFIPAGASEELIAPDAYAHDSTCEAYLNILDILGTTVDLFHVTTAFSLPTIRAYIGEKVVAVTTHWNALAAVREALKTVVITLQTRLFPSRDDQAVSQQERAEKREVTSTFSRRGTLPMSLVDETDYRKAVEMMLSTFSQQGWDIIAIPINRDVTLASVIGCALRVSAVQRNAHTIGEE